MNKIKSLRKERLLTEGKRRGISDKFIADFSVNIKRAEELSLYGLKKGVLDSLARQLRKKFRKMKSFDELKQFIDETISFGSTKIDVESLKESNEKVQGEVIHLLSHCTKERNGRFSFENYEKYLPIKINLGRYYDVLWDGYREFEEGYVFATQTLPKNYRGGKWGFRGRDSYRLYDLGVISANVFFVNIMEEFITKNKETYFYIITKDYVDYMLNKGKRKEVVIPTNDVGELIKSYINQFELLPDGVEVVESEGERGFVDHFLLDDHIVGGKLVYIRSEFINNMMLEFLESTNSLVVKVDQEARMSSHARAFETKKHINKSTEKAMKNNHFLSKYGYVEIDNDVDLDKFQKLSEEFYHLTKQIYIPEAEDHSFRIKKLGRHRAAGIYFSGAKSTIVDIDNPDSYIHELGHQIDYTLNGKSLVSETLSFRHIIDEYKALVKKRVNELASDDPFYKTWYGNSSYNSDYYFQPTEIFARSYELYIESKGIETSFLKDKYDTPVYPKDESFIKLVVNYFDNLFSFFEPVIEESKEEKKVVANVKTFNDVESFEHVEQLSFFL